MSGVRRAAGWVVVLLWAAHLGYPMQRLQSARWVIGGYAIPVYYFFTALPAAAAAGLALASERRWMRWTALWWLLPVICIPGLAASSDRVWSAREWLSWIIRGVAPGGVLFLVGDRRFAETALKRCIYPVAVAAALLGLVEVGAGRNLIWESLGESIPAVSREDNPFYRPAYFQYAPAASMPPEGTQGNRVPYAACLVGFLPFAFWMAQHDDRLRTTAAGTAGLLMAVIVFAQVRAAWLGMAICVAVAGALATRLERRRLRGVFAVAAVCVLAAAAMPSAREALAGRLASFKATENSISQRLAVVETAQVLKDRGWTGVGFGQFPAACRSYYHSSLSWNGTPDDQYLRWAIENGLPSAALLFAFLFGLVAAGWRQTRQIEDAAEAGLYKALLTGWAGLAVMFLFFDGFYWGACNMTFWALLGLFATCLKPSSEGPLL